jgi:hypothetical protein
MHLPSAALLEELSTALDKIYDDSGSIVIDGRLWRIARQLLLPSPMNACWLLYLVM